MTKKDKLIERFLSMPKDFTFDELTKLLAIFGYSKGNKGKTSGSRVIFKQKNMRPIMVHKPHPSNIVRPYALKQVWDDLLETGFLKKEEETT
jgi:hypothetical protein